MWFLSLCCETKAHHPSLTHPHRCIYIPVYPCVQSSTGMLVDLVSLYFMLLFPPNIMRPMKTKYPITASAPSLNSQSLWLVYRYSICYKALCHTSFYVAFSVPLKLITLTSNEVGPWAKLKIKSWIRSTVNVWLFVGGQMWVNETVSVTYKMGIDTYLIRM